MTKNLAELSNEIRALIGDANEYRGDCPRCGGKNSFSVTNNAGRLLFHCFRNSCGWHGYTDTRASKSAIIEQFKPQEVTTVLLHPEEFVVPDYFTFPLSHTQSYKFMEKWGLIRPYSDNAAKLRYDVRYNRLVFLIERKGQVVSAVGRSLDRNGPKWYMYAPAPLPFVCGILGDVLVITEDCIGACTVYEKAKIDGMALLGTAWQHYDFTICSNYKKIYICLDPDANKKAFDLQKTLLNYANTEVKFLDKDLKYYERQELTWLDNART